MEIERQGEYLQLQLQSAAEQMARHHYKLQVDTKFADQNRVLLAELEAVSEERLKLTQLIEAGRQERQGLGAQLLSAQQDVAEREDKVASLQQVCSEHACPIFIPIAS